MQESPVQYRLVTATDSAELDAAVNELLGRGWTLHEGPSVAVAPASEGADPTAASLHYAQAMTLTAPTQAAEAAEARAEVGELLERVGVSELAVPQPPTAAPAAQASGSPSERTS
jgi:hypothetical protein